MRPEHGRVHDQAHLTLRASSAAGYRDPSFERLQGALPVPRWVDIDITTSNPRIDNWTLRLAGTIRGVTVDI
jgi:hypothetical protein